jgi:preprotein translocase subunit SecY
VRGSRTTPFKYDQGGQPMRVNMLRVIAIALIIVLVDIELFEIQWVPDLLGLVILFFCAVLYVDKAGRFARTAVVAAAMAFLEVVRLFNLAESAPVINILNVLYIFLTVLLVITTADGVGQFCQLQGRDDVAKRCDTTGHVYSLTFVFWALSAWFEPLSRVFWLLNLLVTVFTLVMFAYFYTTTYVAVQEQFETPPDALDEEEEDAEEADDAL